MDNKRILLVISAVLLLGSIIIGSKTATPDLEIKVESFDDYVIMTIEHAGLGDIYYTLDGSTPAETSIKYTEPVHIGLADYNNQMPLTSFPVEKLTENEYYHQARTYFEKLLVIKAKVVIFNGYSEKTITKTVDVNHVQSSMDMISITINQEDFLGEEKGIYLSENSQQYGKEWERTAYMEYFDAQGNVVVSNDIGIRVSGHSSRQYLQKSFRIYPKVNSSYSVFKYDFFNNDSNAVYESINLKNGGNNTDSIKYVNSFIHDMTSQLSFSTQAARPVVVYINGEYWGVYILTEDYDSEYCNNHFNVSTEDAIIISATGKTYTVKEGTDSDIELWNSLVEFAKTNSMLEEENYRKLCQKMDVENFAEWLACELYIGNEDLSYRDIDEENNIYVWRTREILDKEYYDGRWRWMLQDVDNAFAVTPDTNSVENLLNMEVSSPTKDLFRAVIVNDDFYALFAEQLQKMRDIVFEQKMATEKWNEYFERYRPELIRTYRRFNSGMSIEDCVPINNYAAAMFHLRGNAIDNMLDTINQCITENKG